MTQKMWAVYRQRDGEDRMYFDGTSSFGGAIRAACWADRRDASFCADLLLERWPGPVDAPWVYGEQCIVVKEADPRQLVPGE